MWALFKFMSKRQFKTAGFWIGILLPITIMGLFFDFLPGDLKIEYAAISIATGITIGMVLGWGQTFSIIKTSSLFKGIRTSNIRKREYFMMGFLSSLLMFVVLTTILFGTFIIFIYTNIIDIQYQPTMIEIPEVPVERLELTATEYLKSIDWLAMSFGFMNIWILSSLMAFFFTSISKTQTQYQTITWGFMLIYIFFGGLIMPMDMLRMPISVQEAENETIEQAFIGITYAIPTAYSNFYLADIMTNPLQVTMQYNPLPVEYLEYTGINHHITWIIPFAYDAAFAIGGLALVTLWD